MRDNMDDLDSQGFNCLYYAVYHGHLPVVKLLKSVQVAYQKDKKGTSCVHVAIMRGHLSIVEFLLKKTPKYIEDGAAASNSKQPQQPKNDALKKKEEQTKALIRKTN